MKKSDRDGRIQAIADYFKELVTDASLSKEEISLDNTEYEYPNIVSKYYASEAFTEEELVNDLHAFVNEYNAMIGKLDDKSYREVIGEIAGGKLEVDQGLFDNIKANGAANPMDDPTTHDGSYEITKKVLELYNALPDADWENVSQNDLFFLLTCSLIRQSACDSTIDKYLSSSLLSSKTEELHTFFDSIWAKATGDTPYTNSSAEFIGEGKLSVGLFSRSEQFRTINEDDTTLKPKIKAFINMCIELNDLADDKEDDAITKVQGFINTFGNLGNFQGKASQILHDIKPKFFPILNGPGRKVYSRLGVALDSPEKFENYARCCTAIKEYRDKKFPEFKNYRVIDFYGSRYLHLNEDEKIVPVDFEAICAWLRDHGGKPYRKGDESGKKSKKEFDKFFKMVVNNRAFSFDNSQWQNQENALSYFWDRALDPAEHKYIKEKLSISMSTWYDASKTDLCIVIRLESQDKEIETLPVEERKEINRRLLQKIEGAIYQDNNKKEYTYEEALAEIEKDDNYASKAEFKIRPNNYLTAPFLSSETERIVGEARELAKKYIDAYYEMVKGDERLVAEKLGKNMILFGPPGTGKTYNSKIYAVAICDEKTIEEVKAMDYETEVLPRYDELVTEGRVAFTTFHQSYGYEEFIEGIQPLLDNKSGEKKVYYDVMPGIFKKFCEKAPSFFEKVGGAAALTGVDFDKKWQEFVDDVNDGGLKYEVINPTSKIKEKELYVRSGVNVVLPIGSGLSLTKVNALKFFKGEKVEHAALDKIKDAYDYFATKYIGEKALAIAVTDEKTEVKVMPCVFIIDEINRGNISKIFGELITLIEESKRQDAPEAMSCTLPYSGESFSVPGNVYILGTMNTADRSIAIMDTALRRRFDFVEMLPEKSALDGVQVDGLDIPTLLETINKRIELLYDREHTIGHAYFMPLKKESTIEVLSHIFKDRVLPLLQEYFYEDYNKIRLIFGGNAFIIEEPIIASKYFKSVVPEGMLQEKKYTINEEAFADVANYKNII